MSVFKKDKRILKYNKLRQLDFIDIFVIVLISKGMYPIEIAKKMKIRPSCLTHRKKKHLELFKDIYSVKKGATVFNPEYKKLADRFKKGFEILWMEKIDDILK